MNILRPLLTALVFTFSLSAQAAPGAAPAAPGATVAKPKPYSSGDTRAYITLAEAIQFQLNMSLRLRHKHKEDAPEMVAFAGKIHQAATALWTPGVDAAMAHGVQGKLIPQEMAKDDKAALAKLNSIKDEKKKELAWFELYAKESKKYAADVEKLTKVAQDPDLKAYAEKTAALLKSQAETVEAKYQELKSAK